MLSGSQWPPRKQWIFQAQVECSGALTDLLYGGMTYSSCLKTGIMRVSSDYQDGASEGDLLPIWSLEGMLSPWFQRSLQPLPLGGRDENSHCGRLWGECGLLRSTTFPISSLFPMPCLLSYTGYNTTSRGLNTAWPPVEVFVLDILATIYKDLWESELGIVCIYLFWPCRDPWWRLQTEVRPQVCRDGSKSVK